MAVAFAYFVGMLLIADSTIPNQPWWITWANGLAGLWFVVAASITGWQNARSNDFDN